MVAVPDNLTLEAWIEECIGHLRDAKEFDVLAVHSNEFLLLYGVAARIVRYSDAYLQLARSGFLGEAVVLARTALEHAVTLQWVFIVDGGIDRYRLEVAHERIEHYRNLAGWLESQQLAEAVADLEAPPEGKRLPPFMNMLRELDQDRFLEASYHILSQHVHVTHAAVASFVVPAADDLQLKYDQDYGYRYQATYVVATTCMMARWVIAKLTDDRALLERLDRASDSMLLPMNLIESVPKNRRRTGFTGSQTSEH